MKFSNLPVMGERNWFNHVVQSIQEAGSTVSIDPISYDYVLGDGAKKASSNQLYVWRTVLSDKNGNYITIVGGAGSVYHPTLQLGQHFTIKLPWNFGTGAQVTCNVFDTNGWKAEMAADGSIQFIALQNIPGDTNWIDFRAEWPSH